MKKAFGGCMIFIQRLIQWTFTLAFLALVFYGLAYLVEEGDEIISMIAFGLMVLLALFILYRIFISPFRRKAAKVTVPASILRIDIPNNVSQPILYNTVVMFESRGKRIQIKLTPEQINNGFLDKYAVGDTGMLTYTKDRMYDWVLPTPEKPMVNVQHKTVFISYSHQWGEDAEYIAQYFRQSGLNVWLDKAQLRVGDRLTDQIRNAIRNATYFMPLLSQDYWNSEWCIQEFELASELGIKFIPIKVSGGELVMPPHIRDIYRQKLGEPIFLDLRGRNPVGQLRELAREMTQ